MMMMMSTSRFLFALLFTVTCTGAAVTTTVAPGDVGQEAKQLAKDVRTVIDKARSGNYYLDALLQNVLDLQAKATDLLDLLPGEVSECETNLVVKMAAAATGSHEVLTVLLAEDKLSVLNGRLTLSLAVLEHINSQLEDELSRSSEVGPHLSAIIFTTNTTAAIIDTADKTVKGIISFNANNQHNRVRRQSLNLGRGWSVGLGGVKWQSSSGLTTFNARPTFSGFKPSGFQASLKIRF